MSSQGIDVKGLCSILREGARSGVARLKTGDLEIEFHQDQLSSVSHKQSALFEAGQPRGNKKTEGLVVADATTSLEPEGLSDDFHEVQMMIDDPVGYEEQMIRNHLQASVEQGANERTQTGRSQSSLHGRG